MDSVDKWITYKGRRLPVGKDGKIIKQEKYDIEDIDLGKFENTNWKRINAKNKITGEVEGYLKYKFVKGEAQVEIVNVNENARRKGIAKSMMKKLQEIVGDNDINFGPLTEDGEKLMNKIATFNKKQEKFGVMNYWGRIK